MKMKIDIIEIDTHESIVSFAIKTHFGSLYPRRDEAEFHLTLLCNFYNNILSLHCFVCRRLSIHIEKSTYFRFGYFFSLFLSFAYLSLLLFLTTTFKYGHDRVYE